MASTVNEDLAGRITGRKGAPGFLTLDASVLEHADTHRIIRENIKQNMIEFCFPQGLNVIDLHEEIEALAIIESGDNVAKVDRMYDVTMQLLVDKDLQINMRDEEGVKHELCLVHVVDRYQNMRGIDIINKYPSIMLWLCDFMGEHLIKKYPLPGQIVFAPQAAQKKTKGKKART